MDNASNAEGLGDVHITVSGLWVDTILYEIPLLALVSEAYFKFCDKDWNYDGQEQNAYNKGKKLLANGCVFSEFGTRRRRDYHAQELVIQGLMRAAEEEMAGAQRGKLSGTSNVHFAMRYRIPPVGTVAHEWFMGIAAATDDYEDANETALRYWVGCFGKGILGIALTDTFGTPAFLRAFKKTIPKYTLAGSGAAASTASTTGTDNSEVAHLAETNPPLQAPITDGITDSSELPTYAEVFTGTRQDSGDPAEFVKMMREFYDKQGIRDKKTIVFSDSLNIERCLEYKEVSEKAGFQPTFGVGTFLTSEGKHSVAYEELFTKLCILDDFSNLSNGKKSVPLNIVIKLSSVEGKPAVKISDNLGKNTGDARVVEQVKHRLGYVEKEWAEGDEAKRWGTGNDKGTSMAPAA